jgi:hypothetical protein
VTGVVGDEVCEECEGGEKVAAVGKVPVGNAAVEAVAGGVGK